MDAARIAEEKAALRAKMRAVRDAIRPRRGRRRPTLSPHARSNCPSLRR